jgi:hypothetical protein
MRRCAAWPATIPWHCATTPVRPMRHTLERGRRSPRREDRRLRHARTGQRRDVRPAGPVTSVAIGPVRPSPPSPTPSRALHHHPQHCGGTGRQDAATPAAVRPAAFRLPHPRAYVQATTERATPTSPPSKSFLDGYRARHDTPQTQDSPGRPSTPWHCAPCLYT